MAKSASCHRGLVADMRVSYGSKSGRSSQHQSMTALPPKADMFSVELDVCFVPIADIGPASDRQSDPAARQLSAFGDQTNLRRRKLKSPAGGFRVIAQNWSGTFALYP